MSRSRADRFKGHDEFEGFKDNYHSDFWKYPNELEEHWYYLSGSEQKVLDFILRQTFGFRKSSDWISLSQFVNGVGEKNHGTGLSISQVRRAITGLEEKGFIIVERHKNSTSKFFLTGK